MIEYLQTDTITHIDTYNTIDTVIYGYEVDNACMLYEQEYLKLNTTLVLTKDIDNVSINEGIIRANTLNILYDGQLDNYHMLEAGYESMIDSGKDILSKIWEFITKAVKGLINFIKSIYHKIIKFISSLFKDSKKQKKDILKLKKEVNDREKEYSNIVSSSIGSGGSSGAAGIDTDSPTGDTNIDKKAEEIHNTVTDTLNNEINKHNKVKNKIKDITDDYSILTHLHTYYNANVIVKYKEMIQELISNNAQLIDHSNNLHDLVLGYNDDSGYLTKISKALLTISTTQLEEVELREMYEAIIEDVRDVIGTAISLMNKINTPVVNEDLNKFKSMIMKDEGYKSEEVLVITDISVNTIGYIKLTTSSTILAQDTLSLEDRIAILEGMVTAGATGTDNNIAYVSTKKELTLENFTNSIRSILRGYVYIANLSHYKRYTYKVKPDKDVKDTFFNNRSDIIYKNIHERITKYLTVNALISDTIDDVKDVLYKKEGLTKIELDIVDNIGESILHNTILPKNLFNSNILSYTHNIINEYDHIELDANKLSSVILNINLKLIDDLKALDRKLMSVISIYIGSTIRS